MSSLLLTEDEIVGLTDYEKPRAQCKQLQKMGITFSIGRTGKPKVLRDCVIKKLGGNARKKEPMVNVDALNSL